MRGMFGVMAVGMAILACGTREITVYDGEIRPDGGVIAPGAGKPSDGGPTTPRPRATVACPAEGQAAEHCDGGSGCSLGVGLNPYEENLLMRNMSDGQDGQRLYVRSSGVVRRVRVAAWGGAAEISILRECEGRVVLLGTGTAANDVVPAYDGIRSPLVLTEVDLSAPIAVYRGDVLEVRTKVGVGAVRRNDPDPFGEMFSERGSVPDGADIAIIVDVE